MNDATPEPLTDHAAACDFYSRPAPLSELGLCPRCASTPNVVCMYARATPPRPPGWGEKLKELARRVAQRLPLFGPP